jgi:membrane-bound lytic murein transglycosylase A
VPLGSPAFLSTTYPNDSKLLQRLMLAQDTGGAIKGGVRADFFWGAGNEAGKLAGAMKQQGRMWVLLPKEWSANK